METHYFSDGSLLRSLVFYSAEMHCPHRRMLSTTDMMISFALLIVIETHLTWNDDKLDDLCDGYKLDARHQSISVGTMRNIKGIRIGVYFSSFK